jgi:hypothetical protein
MKRRLLHYLSVFASRLRPQPTSLELELVRTNRFLTERAAELAARNDDGRREYMERIAELAEARQMAGSGPWAVGPEALRQTDALLAHAYESFSRPTQLRESLPIATGATGLIDMMMANAEWIREGRAFNLEFSRWGITQIILICRLYYLKNPIVRRLVDVCAAYVFARGVEISSPDESLTTEIDQFIADNPKTLGHRAMMELEKRKDYDGNIFFVFFSDTTSTGKTTIRTIDATEISEIETDPEDTDTPWFYHRVASQSVFDPQSGTKRTTTIKRWYPALDYDPAEKPATIGGDQVMWDSPVYHSKVGYVGKWTFGCPRAYPATVWANESKRYLESCASMAQSNAQIARDITAKGGQQAIEGIKAQLNSTVGPGAPLLEQNPTAVAGSTFVHGPGMKQEVMKTRGAGNNPEEVRRFLLMCCMVWGVPETFLGDVSTGNLATATSLDRPTETIMLEKQEAWREDLIVLVLHHLEVSKSAPKGRLREALNRRRIDLSDVKIRECSRVPSPDGKRMVYAPLQMRPNADGVLQLHEAGRPVPKTELVVRVNFPAIREGDLKTLVDATVEAMTLGNRAGQVIGIDEKEGTRKLYDLLEFEDGDEKVEQQYPEKTYEIDRTKEVLPPPIKRMTNLPGGSTSQIQPGINVDDPHNPGGVTESAAERALRRLARAFRLWEAQNPEAHNGREHAEHR